MNSFTSNSNIHIDRTRNLQGVFLFAAAFLTPLVATSTYWVKFAPRYELPANTEKIIDLQEYYLAAQETFHYDHLAYYRGRPDILKSLSEADVVFLGNSRLMLGLSQEALRPFFRERGIRYHVMGFSWAEENRYPELIMNTFQIWPKLVVVNADSFFAGHLSTFARKIINADDFGRAKMEFEGRVSSDVGYLLHGLLPNFARYGMGTRRRLIIYRSRYDGTWLWPWEQVPPSARFPIPPRHGDVAGVADEIKEARRFKADLDRHGSKLVLMLVPNTVASRERVERIAKDLGVPLIAPTLKRPETFDGSHLTKECANEFAELVLRELDPILKQSLDGDSRVGKP
jgi:hypothetical protein